MSKAALRSLKQSDPKLAAVIDRVGPYRADVPLRWTTFEALSRSIVYQQLSGKAAGTIYGRFVRAFGHAGKPVASYVAKATDEELRAVGLSRGKSAYIRGLAAMKLPTAKQLAAMADEEVIAQLTQAKGIGRWTVQMLLMGWMQRPDVLPADDLGIQKGLMKTYRLRKMPTPERVLREGKKWQPYRSIASWYLWRVTELD